MSSAKELFGAAKDHIEDLVKACIANGADVDGHRDKVRKVVVPYMFLF